MKIVISGGPKTGKTTLAKRISEKEGVAARHTDDLIGKMDWSESSEEVSRWLDAPDPWIIEGVSTVRALRKWKERNPGKKPPFDEFIHLMHAWDPLSKGQSSMAKGIETVYSEIKEWLE